MVAFGRSSGISASHWRGILVVLGQGSILEVVHGRRGVSMAGNDSEMGDNWLVRLELLWNFYG